MSSTSPGPTIFISTTTLDFISGATIKIFVRAVVTAGVRNSLLGTGGRAGAAWLQRRNISAAPRAARDVPRLHGLWQRLEVRGAQLSPSQVCLLSRHV